MVTSPSLPHIPYFANAAAVDSVIKAVLDDLRAPGEPTTAEAVAERLFVLNVDEVTPEHDAYNERMLPAVRDYLNREGRASL